MSLNYIRNKESKSKIHESTSNAIHSELRKMNSK